MPFPNEVAALEALNVRVSRGLKRLARHGHQGGKLAEPLDEAVDHQLGANGDHVILEYGDYECPILASCVSRDPTGGTQGRVPFRLPTLPADGDPPARTRG